jgi:hypothetical protein
VTFLRVQRYLGVGQNIVVAKEVRFFPQCWNQRTEAPRTMVTARNCVVAGGMKTLRVMFVVAFLCCLSLKPTLRSAASEPLSKAHVLRVASALGLCRSLGFFSKPPRVWVRGYYVPDNPPAAGAGVGLLFEAKSGAHRVKLDISIPFSLEVGNLNIVRSTWMTVHGTVFCDTRALLVDSRLA